MFHNISRISLLRHLQPRYFSTTQPHTSKCLLLKVHSTGIQKNLLAPFTPIESWPRVVSLTWRTYTSKKEWLSSSRYVVYPDDFSIPVESVNVHGITTEHAKEHGTPRSEIFTHFITDLQESEYIIAHNIKFDYQVLRSELFRANLPYSFPRVTPISLLDTSSNLLCLPYANSKEAFGGPLVNFKPPKLTELYKFLFDKDLNLEKQDVVEATADCFFELVKRNVIVPKEIVAERENMLRKLYL